MANIRKRPSGKWQVQIRLKGLKTITRTFETKTKATEFARKVEGDSELARKLGEPVVNQITFSELVKLYLADFKGRDPSAYSRINYWKDKLGVKLVTEIDEFVVDEELIKLGKKWSGSTVNRYKSHLSAIFIFFIRHPEFKRIGFTNPVRKEAVSCFRENPSKDRFLSEHEQKSLIIACKQANWDKMYLLILLALTTGARKGEMLGLKWSDISFQDRIAFLGTTKNGKPRFIPLVKQVVEEMMKFRGKPENLVFHSTVSKERPYDIKKQWRNALKAAGISVCRFHDLRHTAASNYIRAGRSLFEVGTLLGHSSPQMTARYSHLAIHDTLSMADAVAGGIS